MYCLRNESFMHQKLNFLKFHRLWEWNNNVLWINAKSLGLPSWQTWLMIYFWSWQFMHWMVRVLWCTIYDTISQKTLLKLLIAMSLILIYHLFKLGFCKFMSENQYKAKDDFRFPPVHKFDHRNNYRRSLFLILRNHKNYFLIFWK